MTELRIATRRSLLALAQARRVAELLYAAHPGVSVATVEVETTGDRDRTGAIAELTEIGAFVREVQRAVLEGRADMAVHSLKDLPVTEPGDLVLAAFPERVGALDVMVGAALDDLPDGSVVGTGSPRRSSQLLELRPDLTTVELRGNIDTRLDKVRRSEVDAAVLAEAGLIRLGRDDAIAQRLTVDEMVPAPGQGALAVETRPGTEAAALVGAIDDPELRRLASVERDLLAVTGAGCRAALGALATTGADGSIRLEAFVADDQGARRVAVQRNEPSEVVAAAREGLAL